MRDGFQGCLPGGFIPVDACLVVSFPTNFLKSSPYFPITNLLSDCETPHQLPQSASESIALIHLCASKMHSTPRQSMTWLSSQYRFLSLEPNSYSWLPCFCQMHPSQRSCQMRRRGCGTILPRTGCVRQWRSSALLRDTSTVPICLSVAYCLGDTHFFFENWTNIRFLFS